MQLGFGWTHYSVAPLSQASIVGRALMEHVDEARSRGWCVPELEEVPEGGRPQGPPRLKVEGMWPYWKDKLAQDTVRNDLVLDRIILLTGPNMAGKGWGAGGWRVV